MAKAKSGYLGKTLDEVTPYRREQVRATLRREFADFFNTMTVNTPTWPAISNQQLVEALADALLDMGKERGLGVALLQTFVYELQDRVNQSLS